MKTERVFLSITLPLLLLTFAQTASAAYMKYTYQTPVMNAVSEQSYDDDGIMPGRELFWSATEQLEIAMILPEIQYELEEMEVFYQVYDNPVVSITGSHYFNNIRIDSSNFIFEAWKVDGHIYQDWWLTFDITDSNFPNDMERRASFRSTGSSSYMTLYQDNYYARGCAGQYPPEWEMGCWEGIYDSVVEFEGHYDTPLDPEYPGGINRMHGERIAVSEPFTPFLLLTALASLLFSRRLTLKSSES
ncbi:MAG TPA: hypothetical protein VLC79_10835 [Cellvibrio sp.]|nr:hypothetical protein [Cellvibrio sp.]